MDVRIRWGENATVFCRIEADDGRFFLYTGEWDLDLLEHIEAIRSNPGAVENMEFDQIRSAAEQKRQRLVRVEPNRGGNLRNVTFKVFERPNLRGDRHRSP